MMVDTVVYQDNSYAKAKHKLGGKSFSPPSLPGSDRCSWTDFHCILCLGMAGFFVFWIFLLLRYNDTFSNINLFDSLSNDTLFSCLFSSCVNFCCCGEISSLKSLNWLLLNTRIFSGKLTFSSFLE